MRIYSPKVGLSRTYCILLPAQSSPVLPAEYTNVANEFNKDVRLSISVKRALAKLRSAVSSSMTVDKPLA